MIEGLAALLYFVKVTPNAIIGDNSKPSPHQMESCFLLTLRLGCRLLIHKQEWPLSQPLQLDLIYVALSFRSCDQQNRG